MTINPFLKPSCRNYAEQLIGLGILLLFSFAAISLNPLLSSSYHYSSRLFFKSLPLSTFHGIFLGMFFLNTLSFWCIWRKESLRRLKIETSLFISLFIFSILWQSIFFLVNSSLLSLIVLLFSGCLTLLLMALFWKREKLAICLLIPYLLWIMCLSWNNLSICLKP